MGRRNWFLNMRKFCFEKEKLVFENENLIFGIVLNRVEKDNIWFKDVYKVLLEKDDVWVEEYDKLFDENFVFEVCFRVLEVVKWEVEKEFWLMIEDCEW